VPAKKFGYNLICSDIQWCFSFIILRIDFCSRLNEQFDYLEIPHFGRLVILGFRCQM